MIEKRRSGRTTRQIDDAIQRLFTQGSIEIPIDHSQARVANQSLYRRLVNRLHSEHQGMWAVDRNKIYVKSKDRPRVYIATKSKRSDNKDNVVIGEPLRTTVIKKGDIYTDVEGYIEDRVGARWSVDYLVKKGYLEERKNEE